MRDRGVAVSLYLNIERAPQRERDLASYAERALARFLAGNWPFGAPYPVLHYDPRTLDEVKGRLILLVKELLAAPLFRVPSQAFASSSRATCCSCAARISRAIA